MQRFRMFGLVTLGAVAAMALVGATSAMAENTSLCESDTAELACADGVEATHVHLTTLTGEKASILTSVAHILCDVLYLGDTLGLAAPLVIHGNFTWSNCETLSGSPCTVTQLSSSALMSLLKTDVELGKFFFVFEALVECPPFVHCVFNGSGLEGHALGSLSTGHQSINEQILNKVSGFLCPKTTKLDILLGSLTELFIRN